MSIPWRNGQVERMNRFFKGGRRGAITAGATISFSRPLAICYGSEGMTPGLCPEITRWSRKGSSDAVRRSTRKAASAEHENRIPERHFGNE